MNDPPAVRGSGFDDGTGYDWVQNLRPDGWQMGFMVGDVSYLTKVLDPGTGRIVWEFHGSSVGPQSCSETAVDGLVPCLIDSGLHELENDELAWRDWSTGDIVGSVSLAGLDLVGDYSTTAVRVVDGQVVRPDLRNWRRFGFLRGAVGVSRRVGFPEGCCGCVSKGGVP